MIIIIHFVPILPNTYFRLNRVLYFTHNMWGSLIYHEGILSNNKEKITVVAKIFLWISHFSIYKAVIIYLCGYPWL